MNQITSALFPAHPTHRSHVRSQWLRPSSIGSHGNPVRNPPQAKIQQSPVRNLPWRLHQYQLRDTLRRETFVPLERLAEEPAVSGAILAGTQPRSPAADQGRQEKRAVQVEPRDAGLGGRRWLVCCDKLVLIEGFQVRPISCCRGS
jgi:hypothetical protein